MSTLCLCSNQKQCNQIVIKSFCVRGLFVDFISSLHAIQSMFYRNVPSKCFTEIWKSNRWYNSHRTGIFTANERRFSFVHGLTKHGTGWFSSVKPSAKCDFDDISRRFAHTNQLIWNYTALFLAWPMKHSPWLPFPIQLFFVSTLLFRIESTAESTTKTKVTSKYSKRSNKICFQFLCA